MLSQFSSEREPEAGSRVHAGSRSIFPIVSFTRDLFAIDLFTIDSFTCESISFDLFTIDLFTIDSFTSDPTAFSAWNGAGSVPVLHLRRLRFVCCGMYAVF